MAKDLDPAMTKVLALFENSGKTLDRLGLDMGYAPRVARRAAWQFLRKTTDPHISMLRRFADAMGISIEELVRKEPEK